MAPLPRLFARVISMDQRGIGLSDRMTQASDLETKMDDVRAVLDAAGSRRTTIYGQGVDGGSVCAMFAATYPERTAGLLLWSGQSSALSPPEYPWGWAKEDLAAFFTLIEETWGDEDGSAPLLRGVGLSSIADDAEAKKRWAHTLRNASSRGDALIHERTFVETDFRPVLPSIHVPTTIIARPWDEGDEAAAEWMASQNPRGGAAQAPEVGRLPPISRRHGGESQCGRGVHRNDPRRGS